MSEDCTVRALLAKLEAESTTAAHDGCVVRLSGPEQRGLPMLIFTAAGTSAATYSQAGRARVDADGKRLCSLVVRVQGCLNQVLVISLGMIEEVEIG